MRITKVTTKTGDKGLTSLVGGKRVSKCSLRVEAYGEVDELSSYLGIVRADNPTPEVDTLLGQIQNTLFTVGCDLASPETVEVPRVSAEQVADLEDHLDKIQAQLAPLQEFILPGGCPVGAKLHYARTLARRAERSVVRLIGVEAVTPEAVAYLNRLSDLLFVLARAVNLNSGVAEQQTNFSQKGSEEPDADTDVADAGETSEGETEAAGEK